MRKMICVVSEEVANDLADQGFRYMEQYINNDQKVYMFRESDKLHKILSDKRKYTRKDWFYNDKLLF